jgi:hypothetical protein
MIKDFCKDKNEEKWLSSSDKMSEDMDKINNN